MMSSNMDAKLKTQLKDLDFDFSQIRNDATREDVNLLLNGIEQFSHENDHLTDENQRLKDEINRLQGEQGKPNIRAGKKDGDISSEKERKIDQPPKKKKSKAKKHKLKIHLKKTGKVNPSELPDDAVFKGYDSVVIQDIVIKSENTEFRREVYYSPSQNERFIASLPAGYAGEFGPGIKAIILCLYHDSVMSQPAIHRLLTTAGIHIAASTLSRIITDDTSIFHEEKADIFAAGLQSTGYQHIDDTGARVNGKNHYTHVLCNPFYTAYFTCPKKDRLTLLGILSGGELSFHLNQKAMQLMIELKLSKTQQSRVEPLLQSQPMSRAEIDKSLDILFPNPKKHRTQRRIILEASALVAYQNRDDAIKILVCDDAPQFKTMTDYLSLCWVHEGRHFKKLKPLIQSNQEKVDAVITDLWAFYRTLLAYKQAPSEMQAKILSEEFDTLFTQTTEYDLLDERLRKIAAKKDNLLLVLTYPEIPLHNNPAELGARVQTRKGDVSLQTKNDKGTKAKDTMMTIVQTARKLSVNTLDYIRDRMSQSYQMPSLSSLIKLRSQEKFNSS